jgi:hypothetical protein
MVEDLRKFIVEELNNKEYVQKKIETELEDLRAMKKQVEIELTSIKSLKDNFASAIQQNQTSGNILSPPFNLHTEIIRLMEKKLKLANEIY